MKAQESRSTIPPKHDLDHAVPPVIHQEPEDDKPLLARWLDRAMENPARFWGLVAALVLVVVGLSVIGGGFSLGKAKSDEAWTELEAAKTPGARVEVAKGFPKTQASQWALLQAAQEYYTQGFSDLPANRDAALPSLKKALDLFEEVAADAPSSSPLARVAALGVGRTLEARNELDKAVKQYEKVASNKAWAGTDEASTAAELAKALNTPQAREFYKELYAFKAVEATLPAGGIGNLDIPLPPDHPPIGTPKGTLPFPTFPNVAPAGAAATPANEPNPATLPPPPPAANGLPAEPFAPKAEPKPAESPKADAPKASEPAKGALGLPSDVFSGGKPDAPK